jgi:WS/DGAT/MGAT family acyltransferase
MWPAVREVMTERRAPRTSLNRPIGVERRLALVRHSLAATKDAAHVAGATVNDVILAAVAGGLREALQARGERVDGLVLRVSVPVSLHRRPDAARGNLDGPMAVPVPVGEPDAARRLRLIAAETAARRVRARPRVFVGVLGSRRVQRVLMRYMRHQRMVNAYVANVVGPPKPLMLAGARLLEVFPMVPITANLTLGIGVLSYAGQLNLTVVADRDSWPDLPVFLEGLDRAWSQLA